MGLSVISKVLDDFILSRTTTLIDFACLSTFLPFKISCWVTILRQFIRSFVIVIARAYCHRNLFILSVSNSEIVQVITKISVFVVFTWSSLI